MTEKRTHQTPKRTKGIRDKRSAKERTTRNACIETGTINNTTIICARPTVCIIVALVAAALSLFHTCCEHEFVLWVLLRLEFHSHLGRQTGDGKENDRERATDAHTHRLTRSQNMFDMEPVYGSQFMVFLTVCIMESHGQQCCEKGQYCENQRTTTKMHCNLFEMKRTNQ